MSPEEMLLERFSTVDDPVLGEDVVSLGLVTDVSVHDEVAIVSLAFNAPLSPAEIEMCDEIRACCRGIGLEPELFAAGRRSPNAFSHVRNAVAVGSVDDTDPSTVAANLAAGLAAIDATVGVLAVEGRVGDGTWLESVDPIELDDPTVPSSRLGIPVVRLGVHLPPAELPPAVNDVFQSLLSHVREAVEWGPLDYLVVALPPGASTMDAVLDEYQIDGLAFVTHTSTDRRTIERAIRDRRRQGIDLLGIVETGNGVRCPRCGDVGGGRPPADDVDGVPVLSSLPVDDRLERSDDPPAFDPSDPTGERLRALARSVTDRIGAKNRASVACETEPIPIEASDSPSNSVN